MGLKKSLIVLLLAVLLGAGITPAAGAQGPDIRTIPIAGLYSHVVLSPDGKTAAVYEDGIMQNNGIVVQLVPIQLVDVASGEVRQLIGALDYPASISFSPDSTKLASYTAGGYLFLWDVPGAQRIRQIPVLPGGSRIAFLPDGKTVAMTMAGLPPRVFLWDTGSGAVSVILMQRFDSALQMQAFMEEVKMNLFTALAPAPDGSVLATADGFGRIDLWNLAGGMPVTLVPAAPDQEYPMLALRALNYTADGKQLSIVDAQAKQVIFVDAATGAETQRVQYTGRGIPAVSADGGRVAWINDDAGAVYVWDSAAPDSPQVIPIAQEDLEIMVIPTLPALAFTPDGQTIVCAPFQGDDTAHNRLLVIALGE